MFGILLQQDIQFFATPDATSHRVTLIIFVVVAAVIVIAAVLSARRGERKGGGSTGGIRRQAKKLGLNADQRRALRQLVSALSLQNPERLLSNSAYLNHALRRRMEQIDMLDEPEADRERQKSLLFSVKRAVQNSSGHMRALPSSRQIRVGQIVDGGLERAQRSGRGDSIPETRFHRELEEGYTASDQLCAGQFPNV